MRDDLISRSALIQALTAWREKLQSANECGGCEAQLLQAVIHNVIEQAPPVDAAPVVRCKDCVEYGRFCGGKICMRVGSYYGNTKPNDYCSYGRADDHPDGQGPGRDRSK